VCTLGVDGEGERKLCEEGKRGKITIKAASPSDCSCYYDKN